MIENPQTFRDDRSKRGERNLVRPPLYYARTVGGSSTHYTANFWRFREVDFDERSRLGPIAGTGFADWPISYPSSSRITRRSSGKSASAGWPVRDKRERMQKAKAVILSANGAESGIDSRIGPQPTVVNRALARRSMSSAAAGTSIS